MPRPEFEYQWDETLHTAYMHGYSMLRIYGDNTATDPDLLTASLIVPGVAMPNGRLGTVGLQGDLKFFGGLHGDIHILVTDPNGNEQPANISLESYSPGIITAQGSSLHVLESYSAVLKNTREKIEERLAVKSVFYTGSTLLDMNGTDRRSTINTEILPGGPMGKVTLQAHQDDKTAEKRIGVAVFHNLFPPHRMAYLSVSADGSHELIEDGGSRQATPGEIGLFEKALNHVFVEPDIRERTAMRKKKDSR